MRKKLSGFTLIEVLVVIVIIGILAMIISATFHYYSKKAKDAVKINTVSSLFNVVNLDDSLGEKSGQRFLYSAEDLTSMIKKAGFPFRPSSDNICYFLTMGNGENPDSDSDNRLAIMTWGEATSTIDPANSGLIIAADPISRAFFTQQDLSKEDFSCDASWVFNESDSNNYFVKLFWEESFAAKKPKEDICHNGQTLNISGSAVQAHLGHGDTLGACSDGGSDDGDAEVIDYNKLIDLAEEGGVGSIRSSVIIDRDGEFVEVEREGF